MNHCSCEGKCLLDGHPQRSLQLGKVGSGAAYQAPEPLALICVIKHLYRGLWPRNSLSYCKLDTIMEMKWQSLPAVWIWVLKKHGSRDFSKLLHIFQSHPEVAFAITFAILILSFLKVLFFHTHLQYTFNQEIPWLNMIAKKLSYSSHKQIYINT